jgi:intracellular sulfur oxidation DsrE/DsrF family protein
MEINYRNELFEIAGKMEMIVDFTEIIERVPKSLQDDSEDDVKVELNSVEIVIAGKGIDILSRLTDKQKEEVINNLSIY